MILPATQDRELVVFHVWPGLRYRSRLAVSFAAMAAGVIVQAIQAAVLPGVLLIAAGTLLLVVRGYDNRIDTRRFDPTAEWERVDRERMAELRALHETMQRWDTSAMDVTNTLGAVLFVVVVVGLGIVIALFPGWGRILAIDALVILVPHWLTGLRSILKKPKLMVRVDLIEHLLESAAPMLANHRVHLLMLLQGSSGATRIPDDVKFKVDFKNRHDDFLGLYGQVTLNEVNGKSHPYFYGVLVARRGYGLGDLYKRYQPPDGITAEFEFHSKVEVLILRQTTTKAAGYETDPFQALCILEEGVREGERVAAQPLSEP